jgi:ribosome biogenesis GTPase / thiamine phosphate phosphatase
VRRMEQQPNNNANKRSGIVIKTHSGFYTVQTSTVRPTNEPLDSTEHSPSDTSADPSADRVVCQLRGTLKQADKKTELCVIGDHVEIEVTESGKGVITRILPRQRVLSRVEPSEYAGTSTEREQVLIANPDAAAFVFAAARPTPNPRLLDRFLVAAEAAEIPDIAIVVNKIDLVDPRPVFEVYERIGYTVLYVSAETNTGIDALRDFLTGKVAIFTGPSGVGKSSLLNAIQPGLGRAVGAVSLKLTKGKHTTTNAEMFPLYGGGYVADTPGIRTLAPWNVEPDELDGYYREFRPFVANCQFSDCTHINEPGCAVRAAVERGEISPERYDSYLRLREVLEEEYVY